MTTKGKNKTSKYRKEKREMASNRMQELEDQEMADSKVLKLTEFVTANELATMMDVSVNQVIATCMSIGIMVPSTSVWMLKPSIWWLKNSDSRLNM